MNVLSLFDGISCARVALDRTDIRVDNYYASEIDKYAIQIAQKNYPSTVHIGDVRDVITWYRMMEDKIGSIDLMILGSPCQDLSIAKKDRKGLDGERSGLFWEAIRIHREVKPRWFIYENVNSMKQEWKDQMLKAVRDVDESAYMVMINAALVSAQNRKRIFITNIPDVVQPEDRGILLKDILEDEVDEKYYIKNIDLVEGATTKNTELDFIGGVRNKDWANDGKNYSRNFGQGDRVYSSSGKSTTLSAMGGGRGAKTGLYAVPRKSKTIRTSGRGSGFGDKHNWDMINEIRRLTPVECERLQCLPDFYTDGVSDSQRYKCLGNAFNVAVVAHILSFIPTSK